MPCPNRFQRRARCGVLVLPLILFSPAALARAQDEREEVKLATVPLAVQDVKTIALPPEMDSVAEAEECRPSFPESELARPAGLPGFRAPDLSQRVLFDEPGDGALWALGGRSYKARFDAQSSTYFPHFGRGVPRHYPLSFTLAEVRVGGKPVEFERGVPPERQGSTVLYDRGSVVEFYELSADSMEQKFLFEELPAAGELVIRIAAETALSALETPAGFELGNEHGRASYTRAVALDNAGRLGATSTSFYGGTIEIRVDAQFLAGAAWPVTIDPVIGTFPVAVDPTEDASHADIAYDATFDRYAVVWQQSFSSTDQDVFCALFTSSGALVPGSEIPIDFTSDCWTSPKVANNRAAARFLTVCSTSPDCESPTSIEGRSRAAGANTSGNQFAIGSDFVGSKIHPDVGGDPVDGPQTYFCVAWQRVMTASDHDIHYQLVRTDDTQLYPSTQLVDNSAATIDSLPSISNSNGQRPFSKQHWTVVWTRSQGAEERDIHGAQIRWDGLLSKPTFPIDVTTSGQDVFPSVSSLLPTASGEREYFVAWQRGTYTNHDVMARVLTGSTPRTPVTNLTAMEGPALEDRSDQYPSVDADANTFAVISSEEFLGSPDDYDVLVSTYRYSAGTGRILPEEVRSPLSGASTYETVPRIVAHQSATDGAPALPRRFGAAWIVADEPGTTSGDVQGGIYDAPLAPGIPLCPGDDSGTACPCGNVGQSGRGCANSTGFGARLHGAGSNEISGTPLRLIASALPAGQPGLFFQGSQFVAGGAGAVFGSGLRCCAGSVVRLQVVNGSAGGSATSTVDIVAAGNVQAGDTRCYQFWYRDPSGSPCAFGFNLTNAYEVTWR